MRWVSSFSSDRWGDGACKSLIDDCDADVWQNWVSSSVPLICRETVTTLTRGLETVVIKWLMISPRLQFICCACRAPEDPLFARSTSVTLSQAFDPGWPWSGYQCHHQKCGVYSPLRFTDLLYTPTEMQSKMNTSIKNPCDFPPFDEEGRVDQRDGGQRGRRN